MLNFNVKQEPLRGMVGMGGGIHSSRKLLGLVGNGEGNRNISTSVGTYTSNSSSYFADSWRVSAGGNGAPFDYSCTGSSANFAFHTGHNANSTQWPFHIAVDIGSIQVLNSIDWYKHANAAGNCDVWGSNKTITSANFNDTNQYTYLGRIFMGGSGSASDCTVSIGSFNTGSINPIAGYRWYMIQVQDINTSSLPYPSVGTIQGWAMYGMRLKKV